jgi:hypothetical protein
MQQGGVVRAEPAAILTVTTYESVAIATGLVPTISSVIMRLPRYARALIVLSAAWWLARHVEVV